MIAVTDLDAAGREFEARHRLASVAGGRHPGWGTANRIVPLGDAYLELVAIVDRHGGPQPLRSLGRRSDPRRAAWLGGADPGHRRGRRTPRPVDRGGFANDSRRRHPPLAE